MLKEDAEDDENEDYLEPLDRIHNASKHLLTLTMTSLVIQIEAGKIELAEEEFSLPKWWRTSSRTTNPGEKKPD